MGLFNRSAGQATDQRTLSEVFPPGTPFRLLGGEMKGTGQGTLGPQLMAAIWVTPVTEPEAPPLQFGVWGSLAEQLGQVEDGELPAIVTLSNQSGVWRFEPHGPAPIVDPETGESHPQRVDPLAHLDLDSGATDSPLGAVSEKAAPPAPPVGDAGGVINPVSQKAPTVKPTAIDDSQTFQPGQ
jgi:hypothetical protein